MGKAFFITGTGTNIGKTVVTCSLVRQLMQLKKDVIAIKPVISGWDANHSGTDTLQLLTSLKLEHTQENILKVSPWRFKAPLAPSMAASKENQEIDYAKLVEFCKNSTGEHEYLLCEGAGGVAVPLNKDKTTLNLMHDLGFTVVLVAGSYLGSLSHTITAVKAMESLEIQINSIIVNESVDDAVTLEDVVLELKNFIQYPIYPLRRIVNVGVAWEETGDILECLSLCKTNELSS